MGSNTKKHRSAGHNRSVVSTRAMLDELAERVLNLSPDRVDAMFEYLDQETTNDEQGDSQRAKSSDTPTPPIPF